MPSEHPFDWEQDDAEVEPVAAEPTLAWISGDQEYYPVWSTTLWEQDQIWRTKFDLRTSEQRVQRLAQEAALYIICNDIAHGS